jgi:predicted O-methyltransferase YrrM
MTPPKNPYALSWRYLKSFFITEVWESISTEHNPMIQVVYEYGKIKLNAKTVNYSFGSLHVAFAETFAEYDIARRNYDTVLILGLGAGSIPAILSSYGRNYHMIGVEIDPEMIRLAQKYFNLDYHTNLQIVIADAIQFVSETKQKYDIICVDLFIDYEIPTKAELPDFLVNLKNILSNNGILIYNRILLPQTMASTERFISIFDQIFPESESFKTLANLMMIHDRWKH